MSDNYKKIKAYTNKHNVTLVAVSKMQSLENIIRVYDEGQRIFGENRVQDLVERAEHLPKDISWHCIGHLQKNKVKYIAPFVQYIHSVDSIELLIKINQEAEKNDRIINVLIQFHIADEETKFGLDTAEASSFFKEVTSMHLSNVSINGVMGMASFTNDKIQIGKEFATLARLFKSIKSTYYSGDNRFEHISMGMSGDYELAIENGATMVRIGSAIFSA